MRACGVSGVLPFFFYKFPLGLTGIEGFLLGLTGFDWVLPSFTEFLRGPVEFHEVSLDVAGFL